MVVIETKHEMGYSYSYLKGIGLGMVLAEGIRYFVHIPRITELNFFFASCFFLAAGLVWLRSKPST